MPTKITRKNKFLKKKLNLGKKFKTPSRFITRPGSQPSANGTNDSAEVAIQSANFSYLDLFQEITDRIRDTDEVLVSLEAIDLLEELGLLSETESELMSDYTEQIFDNPESSFNHFNEMIDRLNSINEPSFLLQGMVARLSAIAEDIQGRADSIVEGGYTANEALSATLGGAGVGASVGAALGAAAGAGVGGMASVGVGAGPGGALGGAVGATGGTVVGGAIGFLLGWGADMITEAQERKEKEEAQKASAEVGEIFDDEECFPPPIYFKTLMG